MNILDEVFQTSQDVKEVFLMAREEQETTGQVSPEVEQAIIDVCRERERVITELSDWWLYTDGKQKGLEAQYKPIIDRMRADVDELEKRKEFIKWAISKILPPSKTAQIANEKAYVTYRESAVVEILDEVAIPLEFRRVVTTPMKDEIKTALKSGATIPGARLQINYNAQIKPGGIKAMRNAEKRLKKLMAGGDDD